MASGSGASMHPLQGFHKDPRAELTWVAGLQTPGHASWAPGTPKPSPGLLQSLGEGTLCPRDHPSLGSPKPLLQVHAVLGVGLWLRGGGTPACRVCPQPDPCPGQRGPLSPSLSPSTSAAAHLSASRSFCPRSPASHPPHPSQVASSPVPGGPRPSGLSRLSHQPSTHAHTAARRQRGGAEDGGVGGASVHRPLVF